MGDSPRCPVASTTMEDSGLKVSKGLLPLGSRDNSSDALISRSRYIPYEEIAKELQGQHIEMN